jgi:hypothetical protein
MLKDLQKSVEEEEQVWKAKVGAAEEELQKVPRACILPRGRQQGNCCRAQGSQAISSKDTQLAQNSTKSRRVVDRSSLSLTTVCHGWCFLRDAL